MFRNLVAGVAALGLVASPAMATARAHPAAKLSVANAVAPGARVGPAMKNDRKAIGGGLLIALALAAVAGIVVAASGSDDADSR